MNERILEKLAEAQDSVHLVRDNLPGSYEEFLSMKRLEKDGIYKNIEFAIQNILDICAMIVKNKGLQVPSSDDDVLTEIEDAHIMKKDVVETIRRIKGFRNFLVHRYGVLNDRIA
jgi:uncharacterized protein YutE (UPF0331/DUF86 family)